MSTVQFNLLPPSKYQTMSAQARDAKVVGKAWLVTAACAGLFLLLLAYSEGIQRAQMNSATNAITTKTQQLNGVSDIQTILTIQNQLQSAASLHASQHDTSRIFTYLSKLTPPNASVNNVLMDMNAHTIKIDGAADSATTVNAFIDTLKYTQYKVGTGKAASAFSAVVETNFAITQTGISYSITANFDPTLFANNLVDADGKPTVPQLMAPSSTNTRGGNDPGSLFGGGR